MTEEQQEIPREFSGFKNEEYYAGSRQMDFIEMFAAEYNMEHKRRGQALVFNHRKFKEPYLEPRTGTNKDCASLCASLKHLHFDVRVHNDKKLKEIKIIIKEAARVDHTHSDCILIAILSHGEMGYIHAKDCTYKLESITCYFTATKCPALAGKPKLFFVQACQGDRVDSGITLAKTENDSVEMSWMSCTIPLEADFLFSFSTVPGFISWRDPLQGSWFIQSLCKELDDNGKFYDILTLLTFVSQSVAFNFETRCDKSELHLKKQIPCTITTLTRILKFADKK